MSVTEPGFKAIHVLYFPIGISPEVGVVTNIFSFRKSNFIQCYCIKLLHTMLLYKVGFTKAEYVCACVVWALSILRIQSAHLKSPIGYSMLTLNISSYLASHCLSCYSEALNEVQATLQTCVGSGTRAGRFDRLFLAHPPLRNTLLCLASHCPSLLCDREALKGEGKTQEKIPCVSRPFMWECSAENIDLVHETGVNLFVARAVCVPGQNGASIVCVCSGVSCLGNLYCYK